MWVLHYPPGGYSITHNIPKTAGHAKRMWVLITHRFAYAAFRRLFFSCTGHAFSATPTGPWMACHGTIRHSAQDPSASQPYLTAVWIALRTLVRSARWNGRDAVGGLPSSH